MTRDYPRPGLLVALILTAQCGCASTGVPAATTDLGHRIVEAGRGASSIGAPPAADAPGAPRIVAAGLLSTDLAAARGASTNAASSHAPPPRESSNPVALRVTLATVPALSLIAASALLGYGSADCNGYDFITGRALDSCRSPGFFALVTLGVSTTASLYQWAISAAAGGRGNGLVASSVSLLSGSALASIAAFSNERGVILVTSFLAPIVSIGMFQWAYELSDRRARRAMANREGRAITLLPSAGLITHGREVVGASVGATIVGM